MATQHSTTEFHVTRRATTGALLFTLRTTDGAAALEAYEAQLAAGTGAEWCELYDSQLGTIAGCYCDEAQS